MLEIYIILNVYRKLHILVDLSSKPASYDKRSLRFRNLADSAILSKIQPFAQHPQSGNVLDFGFIWP